MLLFPNAPKNVVKKKKFKTYKIYFDWIAFGKRFLYYPKNKLKHNNKMNNKKKTKNILYGVIVELQAKHSLFAKLRKNSSFNDVYLY